MAVTGTLEQIRAKFRLLVGAPSVVQLSNAVVDDYINSAYVHTLPMELSLWNLKNSESPLMATTPGADRILIPNNYVYAIDWNKFTNIEPPFYVSSYEIAYYQDIRSFINHFIPNATAQTLATGDGTPGPYTGTITNIPVLFDTCFITATDGAGNTLVAEVNAAGTIIGDVLAGGTVVSATGVVAGLTWTGAIPVGNAISIQSMSFVTGRPEAVLYYNKALIFYPVPDIAYETYCTVYYQPTLLEAGDQPEVRDWWRAIAMRAALDRFVDLLDTESYAKLKPMYEEEKLLISRRTSKQLGTQRAPSIFMNYNQWSPS